MENKYFFGVIFAWLLVAFFACDKEEKPVLPSVDTASVDEIYNTSARVGGRVANNGGAEITERGVFWGTSAGTEKTGTKLQAGSGDGTFFEILTGLTSGVKYYVKAYAVCSSGTSYGDETFFTTQINLPTVITSPVTEFSSTTARFGGVISDNGGFEITQRGIYWGTRPDPRLTGTKLLIGSGDGAFSQTLTGLSRANVYYIMAFATNLKGTSYGVEISFSTEPELPKVITASILEITTNSAKAGGIVTSSGGADITERGIYWGTSTDPLVSGVKLIIGNGTGNFGYNLVNLNPGKNYYITAYAVNAVGTSYGEVKSFHTLGDIPEIKTLAYTDLTAASIKLNGIVDANDLSTTVIFEYGPTESYGSSMVADKSPVTKSDTVSAIITGLDSRKLYHYRIKAANDLGIVYSSDSTFVTVITGITGTVRDSEGNTYQTIGIGYQEWMAENLRSVAYNNGTKIPLIDADTSWAKLTSAGRCWYAHDSISNYNNYGALYNWYAVQTGQLCPTNWHVPTNSDITQLVNYLGGAGVAGGKLKETGALHWNNPNSEATDKFKFTARAGGKRFADGTFDFVKVEGNWWTSTEYSTLNSSYLNLLFNYGNSFQAYLNKKSGMSVRCVKD